MKQEILDVFVVYLPHLRKVSNLSQAALGKKLGMSRQTVCKYETGVHKMTIPLYISLRMIFEQIQKDTDNKLIQLMLEGLDIRTGNKDSDWFDFITKS